MLDFMNHLRNLYHPLYSSKALKLQTKNMMNAPEINKKVLIEARENEILHENDLY